MIFLFFCKMNFTALQDDILIVEFCIAELFAGEVEYHIPNFVETVVVAVSKRHSIYFASEYVLNEEGSDGALP